MSMASLAGDALMEAAHRTPTYPRRAPDRPAETASTAGTRRVLGSRAAPEVSLARDLVQEWAASPPKAAAVVPPCSGMTRCGSAPGLVEAAAVQLENKRLREEIRVMCDTIKHQSSQLSQLWSETNFMQAGPGGNGASMLRGVAELSRRRLGVEGASSGPAMHRVQSTGALSEASPASVARWRGRAAEGGSLGSGAVAGGLWDPLPTAPAALWAGSGLSSDLAGALTRFSAAGRLPLFTPALNPPPQPRSRNSRASAAPPEPHEPPHHPAEGRGHSASSTDVRQTPPSALPTSPCAAPSPRTLPGQQARRHAVQVLRRHGRDTCEATETGRVAYGADGAPLVGTPPSLGASGATSQSSRSRLSQHAWAPKSSAEVCLAGDHRSLGSPGRWAYREFAAQGSVSLAMTVQRVDYAMLVARPVLLAAFKAAVKQAVAAEAGSGVLADHVDLVLSAGSVLVQATVTPPGSVPVNVVLSRLSASTAVAFAVATRLAKLEGISAVATGVISVSPLGAPTMSSMLLGIPAIDELTSTTVSTAGSDRKSVV